MAHSNWTREQLLVAFKLYCRTPFGRLHRHNPDIIELSQKIGRSPSAIAMKCCNFASFDPVQQARNVKGLGNTSRADREIWEEHHTNSTKFVLETEAAFQEVMQRQSDYHELPIEEEILSILGSTERSAMRKYRIVQGNFRAAVLTSYEFRCAICNLNLPQLINASHIIPWSKNEERRADPTNGLSLCALHDRAFDRGLLTLDEAFCVVVSSRANVETSSHLQTVTFAEAEGKPITMPVRFSPDQVALEYHRTNIFRS